MSDQKTEMMSGLNMEEKPIVPYLLSEKELAYIAKEAAAIGARTALETMEQEKKKMRSVASEIGRAHV